MNWLLLWPLAGLIFWAMYQAKDFTVSLLGLAVLFGCLIFGPLSWLALLMAI